MIFRFDIHTQHLTVDGNPAGALVLKAKDLSRLAVDFTSAGVPHALTGPAPKLRFVLKSRAGTLVASAAAWTESGDYWTSRIGLDTEALLAAIAGKDAVTLLGQFAVDEDGEGWLRSQTVAVRLTAAIFDELDEFPDGLPGPDDFVAERALLYDREQNLSPEAQAQARANAGAASQADLAADAAALAALITKLTSDEGAFFRLLTDSQGKYALGVLNITTGEYDVLCSAGAGAEQNTAFIPLP